MKIYDTPITKEILETDFQKAFDSTSKFGTNLEMKRIGEGTGFSSIPVVITFDWTPNSQNLPEKALIKIVVKTKEEHLLDRFNDTELRFYLENRENEFDLRLAKFYCGRFYGKDGVDAGYIALEFIENTVIRHLYHNIQEIGVKEVLEELAKLVILSIKRPKIMSSYLGFECSLISLILEKDKMKKHMRIMRDTFSNLNPEFDIIQAKTEVLLKKDSEDFEKLRKVTVRRSVLCHGDIWTPNILWNRDSDGIFHLRAIVDWQFVHIGSPLEDLVLFFHSALSADDYKNSISKYLHFYYDYLSEGLNIDELLWESYDEFEKQYEIAYAYTMSLLLPMTVKMLDLAKSCDASELDECQQNYKEKAIFITHQTVRGLGKWF